MPYNDECFEDRAFHAEEQYIDPYCSICGHHEDNHDQEVCNMIADQEEDDRIYIDHPAHDRYMCAMMVAAAKDEQARFWDMIAWINDGPGARVPTLVLYSYDPRFEEVPF